MNTTRPRTVSIRIVQADRDFGYFAIVYARNGKRWNELGPYTFPQAAERAGRDWASAQGFEVRS